MNVDFLYRTAFGRMMMKMLQRFGLFRFAAWYLRTGASKIWIPRYIKKHKIDMRWYPKQTYDSFADFFARKKDGICFASNPKALISPCDGLLSVYPIREDMKLPLKGSMYRMMDLIPDREIAEKFRGGLCLIFRLQASDYHYFCAFDDCKVQETHFIPGQLHSVQPIACETVPVYRLNRRWWSLINSAAFGQVVQIEIGAMLVGGVSFRPGIGGMLQRGDEMGNFELAGSTIILMLNAEAGRQLELMLPCRMAVGGGIEIPVKMGEGIGILHNEADS